MCLTPRNITHGNRVPEFDYSYVNKRNFDFDPDTILNDVCSYVDDCKTNSPDGSLIIMQLNIRGLTGKQFLLKELIKEGNTNKVDVVLLCETWLRAETKNKISIPGFFFIGKEQVGKKGGGVGILIRDNLVYKRLPDLEKTSNVFEHITIELKSDK